MKVLEKLASSISEEEEINSLQTALEKKKNTPPSLRRPKLMELVRELIYEPCSEIPYFAGVAENLGLDPYNTTIGECWVWRMIKHSIDDPSSPIGRELLNRIEGTIKQQVDIRSVELTMKRQVVSFDGISDDVLEKLLSLSKEEEVPIDGDVVE